MNSNAQIYRNGFTLLEVMASLTLFVVAVGLALGGLSFMLKNINQDQKQDQLDLEVQMAMERLKHDLRLSSLDDIFFNQDSNGSYQAMSFPLGQLDENGILKKDANGMIDWGSQVIYHIKPSTPYQLIKTVFSNRQNLTDARRKEQLANVVSTGNASGTYNAENATSTVLFENLLQWELVPTAGRYDGYHPTYIREKASLGYVLLGPGEHKITFKTVTPYDNSARFGIGIDQLFASSSAAPIEGEDLKVIAYSDETPVATYTSFGSYFGKHQLQFLADGPEQSFSVSVTNDVWKETNFIGSGHETDGTVANFDLSLKDYIVRLKGNEIGWMAEDQTFDFSGQNGGGMLLTAVRIFLQGNGLEEDNGVITASGKKCKLTFAASLTEDLTISHVHIGESSSPTVQSMEYTSGSATLAKFGNNPGVTIEKGTTETSDWIDLEIDKNKNYLVSFYIAGGYPKQWTISGGAASGTAMVWPGTHPGVTDDTSWSGAAYTNKLFGLESLFVSYPTNGIYTSPVFDTAHPEPRFTDLRFNQETPPANTGISVSMRTADTKADLETASWTSRTLAPYNRYVQFKALLTSDGTATPALKDVTLEWAGEEKLTEIGGFFTKGPELGAFEVTIDDKPITSALVVDLEIFDTVIGLNNSTRRVSSSLKVDLTPRNTGKSKVEN